MVSRVTAVKRQRAATPQEPAFFDEPYAEVVQNEPEELYEEEQFEDADIQDKTEVVLVENAENVNKNTQNVHIGTYSTAQQSINTPSNPPTKGEDEEGDNPSVEVASRTHAGTPLHRVVNRVLKTAPGKRKHTRRSTTGSPTTQADIDRLLPPNDGVERNYSGLLENLVRYRIEPALQKFLIHKSNFGQIGHPIWQVFVQMHTQNARILAPSNYLMSQLKKFEE